MKLLLAPLFLLFSANAQAGWVSCTNEFKSECEAAGHDVEYFICSEYTGLEEVCLRCVTVDTEIVAERGCGGPGWATAPRNTQAQQCRESSDGGASGESNNNYSRKVSTPSGLDLEFNSQNTPNRVGAFTVTHTVLDAVPTFFSNYEMKVEIAGRTEIFQKTATDAVLSYTWDGLDNNGNPALGVHKMVVTLTIPGAGSVSQTFNVGVPYNPTLGAGQWSSSSQMSYSPDAGRLHLPGGASADVPALPVSFSGFAPGDFSALSPNGNEVFVFNEDGIHKSTLNALTGATIQTLNYDVNGMLSSTVNAYGDITTYNRNASGELTSIVDPDGLVTTITMTSGRVTSITTPAGDVTSMIYDTNGMLKTFTKPSGRTATYNLDADGNLVSVSYNGGDFFNYAPVATDEDLIKSTRTSAEGRVKTIWSQKAAVFSGTQTLSPLGVKTIIGEQYGPNGLTYWEEGDSSRLVNYTADSRFGASRRLPLKLTEVQDNRSSVTDYTYNTVLNDPADPFSINTYTITSNTNGRIGTRVYTGATKTWVNTSPAGRIETTVIDDFEKPVSRQIGSFTPVTYTYDSRGRESQVSQGGRTTQYTHNSQGFVSQVTNALNETTSYTYDDDGKIETSTLPDLRVVDYEYNSHGDLVEITPSGKPKHSLLYNAFELIQEYLPPVLGGVPAPTQYTYNNDKELIRVDRPDGTVLDYNRDAVKGVLNSISESGSDLYSYTYSTKNGEILTATSQYGIKNDLDYKGQLVRRDQWVNTATSEQIAKVVYNYNDNHWRTKWSVSGISTKPTRNLWYQYNDDGQITKAGQAFFTYGTTDALIRNVTIGAVSEDYTYNSFGELSGKSVQANGSTVYALAYTRDALGRVDTKTETRNGVSHTYDYDYDVSGRLISVVKDGTSTNTYTYDSNNNRIGGSVNGKTTTATYDDQDRLITYRNYAYTYNDNGERTSRINTNNNKTTTYTYNKIGQLESVLLENGKVVAYTYDGMGRRVTRSYDGVLKSIYVYDGDKLVAEIVPSSGAVKHRYIYVTDSHSPDYMIRWSKQYKFIKDHLGNIVMAIDQADGSIYQEIEYDEFGNVLSANRGWLHPFRFAGGIYDGRTRLTKFGVRDYDAQVGQWTSKDPILFDGGTPKLYEYANSDPVNFIDSEGTFALPLLAANPIGAGILAGAAVAVALYPEETRELGRLVCDALPDISSVFSRRKGADYGPQRPEHTKGKRKSTREKHETGDSRKRKDRGKEKGDKRRKRHK